eukprot:jgi/Hompol1/1824/HPOL_005738-RA
MSVKASAEGVILVDRNHGETVLAADGSVSVKAGTSGGGSGGSGGGVGPSSSVKRTPTKLPLPLGHGNNSMNSSMNNKGQRTPKVSFAAAVASAAGAEATESAPLTRSVRPAADEDEDDGNDDEYSSSNNNKNSDGRSPHLATGAAASPKSNSRSHSQSQMHSNSPQSPLNRLRKKSRSIAIAQEAEAEADAHPEAASLSPVSHASHSVSVSAPSPRSLAHSAIPVAVATSSSSSLSPSPAAKQQRGSLLSRTSPSRRSGIQMRLRTSPRSSPITTVAAVAPTTDVHVQVPTKDRFMITPSLPGVRSKIGASSASTLDRAGSDPLPHDPASTDATVPDESPLSIPDIAAAWKLRVQQNPDIPIPKSTFASNISHVHSIHHESTSTPVIDPIQVEDDQEKDADYEDEIDDDNEEGEDEDEEEDEDEDATDADDELADDQNALELTEQEDDDDEQDQDEQDEDEATVPEPTIQKRPFKPKSGSVHKHDHHRHSHPKPKSKILSTSLILLLAVFAIPAVLMLWAHLAELNGVPLDRRHPAALVLSHAKIAAADPEAMAAALRTRLVDAADQARSKARAILSQIDLDSLDLNTVSKHTADTISNIAHGLSLIESQMWHRSIGVSLADLPASAADTFVHFKNAAIQYGNAVWGSEQLAGFRTIAEPHLE